jgi:hypothetical protein
MGTCGGLSETNDITSNLAYDKYQGLLAYGTSAGHIKMYSLKGLEEEIFSAHQDPIEFLLFVPRKLLLFSIDSKNRLSYRDLADNANPDAPEYAAAVYQYVDSIGNDKVTCLYTAPFMTSDDQNHNHIFIGMRSGNVHIYDLNKKSFTNYSIKNLAN